MDTMLQIADAIKRDVGQIIRKNLERDERYKHEHHGARSARWNRAKAHIGKAIDYHLTAGPQVGRVVTGPNSGPLIEIKGTDCVAPKIAQAAREG